MQINSVKKIHRFKIVLILFLALFQISASAYDIKGHVYGQDDKAITDAVITAYALPDTTYINATVSDESGYFCIQYPDSIDNRILVAVQSSEHKPYMSSGFTNGSSIILEPLGKNLKELVVTTRKSSVTHAAGKIMYDPSELKGEAAKAIDILMKMPLVSYENNVAKIFGRGTAVIYINGKKARMDSEALGQYLRTIPFGDVKRVELVLDPGSSQASTNSSCIINLIIDDPRKGLLGSASLYGTYLFERVSPMASLWTGYSFGQLNISVAPFYRNMSSAIKTKDYYEYRDEGIYRDVTTKSIDSNQNIGGSFNIDYTFNSKLWIGAYASLMGYDAKMTVRTTAKERDEHTEYVTSHGVVKSHTLFPGPTTSSGIHGEWKLNQKNQFQLNVDYGFGNTKYHSENEFGDVLSTEQSNTENSISSFNLKYRFNDGKFGDLTAGYSLDLSKMKLDEEDRINTIHENFNAVFAEYRKSFAFGLSISAGLRLEHYNRRTEWNNENNALRQWDLYPSVSCNWNLTKLSQNISFSFSRRSKQVPFEFMNPVKKYTSEYAYATGDPSLRPEMINSFRLSYSVLGYLFFSASFSTSNNQITQYVRNNGDYTVSGYTNAAKNKHFYTNIYFNKKLFPFFRMKIGIMAGFLRKKADLFGTISSVRNWNWYLSSEYFFTISQRQHIQASLSYSLAAPSSDLTGKYRWGNNLGVRFSKRFGNRLTFDVSVSNILNFDNSKIIDTFNYYYNQRRLSNGTDVGIRLTYVFGKYEINTPRYMSNEQIQSRCAR